MIFSYMHTLKKLTPSIILFIPLLMDFVVPFLYKDLKFIKMYLDIYLNI